MVAGDEIAAEACAQAAQGRDRVAEGPDIAVDQVAGDDHQVGCQCVRLCDQPLDEPTPDEWAHVHVRELDDRHPIQRAWQPWQANRNLADLRRTERARAGIHGRDTGPRQYGHRQAAHDRTPARVDLGGRRRRSGPLSRSPAAEPPGERLAEPDGVAESGGDDEAHRKRDPAKRHQVMNLFHLGTDRAHGPTQEQKRRHEKQQGSHDAVDRTTQPQRLHQTSIEVKVTEHRAAADEKREREPPHDSPAEQASHRTAGGCCYPIAKTTTLIAVTAPVVRNGG